MRLRGVDEVEQEGRAGASSGSPRMGPEKSPFPMKKNPAIGNTMPIALNANTKPSTTCSEAESRKLRLWVVADAAKRRTAAMPTDKRRGVPTLERRDEAGELTQHQIHDQSEVHQRHEKRKYLGGPHFPRLI